MHDSQQIMMKCLNLKKFIKFYIISFLFFAIIVCTIDHPKTIGEWDDFFMPTVTLTCTKPHISVYQHDIDRAAIMFPQWSNAIKKRMAFSPFRSKHGSGGMIPWYFPTYAIACIPLVILLPVSIRVYAFAFTNFLVFALMLLIIYKKLKDRISLCNLFLLVLLVTINPIVFNFNYVAYEVFIYSMLGIALVFWYCKEWKKAALFISFAGSMNPVIMIVGIALIADYFYSIITEKKYASFNNFVTLNLKNLFLFGCCFLYSLLPFIYAKFATGKFSIIINGNVQTPIKLMPFYFLSYLFDLNYGFLPYYSFVFLCFLVLVVLNLIRRKWRFVFMAIVFFVLVLGFCRHSHINNGMNGMARYNSMAAPLFIFPFIFYLDKCSSRNFRIIQTVCIFVTTFLQLCILVNFSPILARNVPYTYFTPIARYMLDYFPCLYNPLHTTFNSRTTHVDGGYEITTPVVYADSNGGVRKILASKRDIPKMSTDILSLNPNESKWLNEKFKRLKNKNSYISIPRKMNFKYYSPCPDTLFFFGEKYNVDFFHVFGVAAKTDKYSWTVSDKISFNYRLKSSDNGKRMLVKFNLARVYNGSQTVIAKINGVNLFKEIVTCSFDFSFKIPDSGIIDMEIELPDAKSPASLGQSFDTRKLALALQTIDFVVIDDI